MHCNVLYQTQAAAENQYNLSINLNNRFIANISSNEILDYIV